MAKKKTKKVATPAAKPKALAKAKEPAKPKKASVCPKCGAAGPHTAQGCPDCMGLYEPKKK